MPTLDLNCVTHGLLFPSVHTKTTHLSKHLFKHLLLFNEGILSQFKVYFLYNLYACLVALQPCVLL